MKKSKTITEIIEITEMNNNNYNKMSSDWVMSINDKRVITYYFESVDRPDLQLTYDPTYRLHTTYSDLQVGLGHCNG